MTYTPSPPPLLPSADRAASGDLYPPPPPCCRQLIGQRLVTFRDLEELQARNQQLLAVVRELSAEQETADGADVTRTESHLRLQAELSAAQEELEELRVARLRQESMVEGIVRQRDMYRALLHQQTQVRAGQVWSQPTGQLTGHGTRPLLLTEHTLLYYYYGVYRMCFG